MNDEYKMNAEYKIDKDLKEREHFIVQNFKFSSIKDNILIFTHNQIKDIYIVLEDKDLKRLKETLNQRKH